MNVSLSARTRALALAFLIPGLALAAFAPAAQALPTISIANAEVVEGNSGTKQMVFNVTLSSASAADVWMDWNTQGGSATGGVDYVSVFSSRLTIPAGSTSATIAVTVTGDTLAEGDETFSISPSSFSGADFGGASWPVGKIKNDDALPSISIADAMISEDAGSVLLTVSLPQPAVSAVSFDIVAASGTATSGDDFVLPFTTSMAIGPGETATSFWVGVTNDSTVEANETFTVSLANVNGATVSDASALVTIVNDDGASGPKLTIWDNNSGVTEGDTGTRTLNFDVTLSQAAANDVYFDAYTLNDSAVAGLDYVAKSVTAQKIPAGQTSATFSVTINGDIEVENQERIYVDLGNVTGARVGDAQAYGVINDNDIGGSGSLSIGEVRVTEGNSGTKIATFTVTMSAASNSLVSFDIGTSNNTAIGGEDFVPLYLPHQTFAPGETSRAFNVTILGDTTVESDEYFNVTILGANGTATNTGQGARIYILSDDSSGDPMITVDNSSVVEGNSGTRNMVFTVRLAAAATHQVSYRVMTGDASADSVGLTPTPWDYTPTTLNLTIPAGSTTGTFSVPVKGDTAAEGPEYFDVVISNIVGAYWAGEGHAYGKIIDDDQNVVLSIDNAFVNEGDAGTKTMWITVNLTSNAVAPVTFNLASSNGTATAGSDYVALNVSNQTMAVGETSKIFAVTINGDTLVESDETISFNLSNVSGASLGTSSATVTIRNDDQAAQNPWLNIADVTVSEGNSGTKTANFTVSLTSAATSTVSFDIATGTGSAIAGEDFVAKSLAGQTIAAGQTSKTFAVTINGDTTVELDEWFRVNVTNVSGAILADGEGVGTITNDDFAATPTLSMNDTFQLEGSSGTTSAVVTVLLSAPADHPVTFNIATADGTAVAPGDYTAINTTGTIPAMSTSAQFTFPIIPDTNIEDQEYFSVNVSNVSGATVTDGQAYVSIGNDDVSPTPSLTMDDVTVVEGNSGTKTMTFTVSLSVAAASPVTFDIRTQDDTATAGSDYVAKTLTAQSIPTGQTSKTFTVTMNGDTSFEPNESFWVIVSNVSGPVSVVDNSGVGTISNDDVAPEMFLSIGDVSITEGNSGQKQATFTISLNAPATSNVNFSAATANGTAIAGSDFLEASLINWTLTPGQTSVSQTVTILGDTTPEPNEVFYINLSNVQGATVADGQAAVTIVNDDSSGSGPALSIADVSITEGNSLQKQATFTVTLSAAVSAAVTYNIATTNGTAISGSDYVAKSLTGQSMPAGTLSKTFTVAIKGDTASEPDETFTVHLSNAAGATIADSEAIGTITNDDSSATPTLSIGDASISEGNSGTKALNFTVSLSAASAGAVSFDYATASGTATAGSDYQAASFTQTLAPGETSKVIGIAINGDADVEPDENFIVNLANVVGTATIGDGSATGTITNDDGGGSGPTLSIADVSITEGNSLSKQATFTVTLSAAATGAVTYNIATANGTAVSGTDYVAKSLLSQSIPAGATSKTFTVGIKGDTLVEPNETFFVNVTSVAGATLADGQAVGTITNDDGTSSPSLSISDASISEGNSGTKVATFTVSLSPAASGAVTYNIATADGTATAGSDYVASSLAGESIAAGGTNKTFSVTINGDTAVESDETFTVNLTNVVGATLGDGAATGTISNDDGGGGGSPTLSIGDVSITEGNAFSKQATFTVTLSAAAASAVTYNIATANGTAISGTDYVAKSLSGQSIAAGATSKTFTVGIKGDTVAEPNESFTVNVSSVVGATLGDGQATGTITNDDAGIVSVARFNARGLYDDIDDGQRGPVLTGHEYASLLLDTATKLCARTNTAMIVAVEDVENRAVLMDLADAANASCASQPRYVAVMAEGDSRGFLVEATAKGDARGVQVLGPPTVDASAKLTSLQVQSPGDVASITLLMPQALSANHAAKPTQLRGLGQWVQSALTTDPRSRFVLIGDVTLPGLLDLTARSLPAKSTLPGERVLVSPALLEDFGASTVSFPALPALEKRAQVLQLQR